MDRRAVFLAVVLLGQALLPLHYYLGDDRTDERFAWRMFSPIRMINCEYAWTVDGELEPLAPSFHSAWITLVKRGRMDVTEAVGDRICLVNPYGDVRFHYRCRQVDGRFDVLENGEESACP